MVTEPMTEATAETPTTDERLQEAGSKFLTLMESLDTYGLTFTDLLLGMDTVGYERVGGDAVSMRDMRPVERTATVRRSRLFWQREPLVDRAIGLWTDFTFGTPWSITAKETSFQTLIDEVLQARWNRKIFNRQGWTKSSTSLLVDGERFFAFFVTGDRIDVRTFDPMEMLDPITNPEDKDDIWYWPRAWVDADGKSHLWIYRDWNFVDEDGNPRTDAHPALARLKASGRYGDVNLVPQAANNGGLVWVAQLAINTLGLRGYPLMTSGLDWVRAHREFLRDRSSLTAARAQFAMKGRVKGGAGAVAALKSTLDGPDPLTPGTDGLRRPRASTFITNDGADLEAMNTPQDGASSRNDERALRMMAMAPTGIPPHLQGDIETGNLATAQAVEAPLDRMFKAYQGTWMDFLHELLEHVGDWQKFAGDRTVDIDAPAIFDTDLLMLSQVISAVTTAFPAVKRSTEVLALILTELGLNNVDDIVEELEQYLDDDATADAEAQAAVQGALEALREARRVEFKEA